MKFGSIGAGYIGGALTRRPASLGHDVTFEGPRGPATAIPERQEASETE